MGRRTLIALGAGVLAAVAVASHSCSNDTQVQIAQPDAGPVCNLGSLRCTGAGTTCVNSVCTATCVGGAACPQGYYCEGDSGFDEICAPNTAFSCFDVTQCPAGQTCTGVDLTGPVPVPGFCTSQELLGDGGRQNCSNTPPNDGCSPGALCFQTAVGTFTCEAMPACSQDGTCPPTGGGSTCNVRADGGRLLEGKQRICLLGLCSANSDCPSTRPHCVHGDGGIENTACFTGTLNSSCFTSADCNAPLKCTGADAGVAGLCSQ
jgi:hypothetical protein